MNLRSSTPGRIKHELWRVRIIDIALGKAKPSQPPPCIESNPFFVDISRRKATVGSNVSPLQQHPTPGKTRGQPVNEMMNDIVGIIPPHGINVIHGTAVAHVPYERERVCIQALLRDLILRSIVRRRVVQWTSHQFHDRRDSSFIRM